MYRLEESHDARHGTNRLRFPMRMITTGAPKAGEKLFPGLTAETRL